MSLSISYLHRGAAFLVATLALHAGAAGSAPRVKLRYVIVADPAAAGIEEMAVQAAALLDGAKSQRWSTEEIELVTAQPAYVAAACRRAPVPDDCDIVEPKSLQQRISGRVRMEYFINVTRWRDPEGLHSDPRIPMRKWSCRYSPDLSIEQREGCVSEAVNTLVAALKGHYSAPRWAHGRR